MVGAERSAPSSRGVRVATTTAALLSVLLTTALPLLGLQRDASTLLLLSLVRVVATAAFITAGALRLARWRITKDARSAYLGSCLLLLGGLTLPLFHLARVISQGDPDALLAPLTQVLCTAVCFGLVARALDLGDNDALGVRPTDLVVRAFSVAAGGFVVVLAIWLVSPRVMTGGPLPQVVIEMLLVAGWAALTLAAVRRERAEPWAGRLAPLLAGMGTAELFGLLDLVQPGVWVPAATVLISGLALVAAYCALSDLFDAASQEHQRIQALALALDVAHEAVTQQDAWREELTHDLRNALTGLRAALHTLDCYDDRLDAVSAAQLRAAAMDEVGHLEHLVEGADHDELVVFEVASLAHSVVRTRRAAGQDVRVHGSAGLVSGRPGDLATVLQNLLVNAGVHAPGSPVTLTLTTQGGVAELVVSDTGPGIPEDDVDLVFARGVRGARSTGSGLGLYVSRSLMRKHGGDVELRSHVGGTTFAVVLPTVERRTGHSVAVRAGGG